MKTLLSICTVVLSVQFASAQWIKQKVDTTASFRGLSVVNEKIVWASGTEGTVIKTIDGGSSWKAMIVPGAEKLDFRDIEAFDANTAYILSIGNGESSRIYKTTDGGKRWKEQFRNKDEKAFFDAIACSNKKNCIAISDPIDQYFVFVATSDGGATWTRQFNGKWNSLASKGGEASFAASGTCLILRPIKARPLSMVFVISGGTEANVHRAVLVNGPSATVDYGLKWYTTETPIIKGNPGSGIFSIDMFDAKTGVIVGGNYENPNEARDNLAFTTDGGMSWKRGTGLTGYRSGVAYIDKGTIIAVGTNGTDITYNGGKTWKKAGDEDLNAVAAKSKRAVWAVGPKGMVVKMK